MSENITVISNYKKLEFSINSQLPHLNTIEKGQRFFSKYYNIITATNIVEKGNGVFNIYGFDEEHGLPRDCYYPRDLELVGKNIILSDVLLWHSMSNRSKYSHFEIINDKGIFIIYDGEEKSEVTWDLSKPLLKDQASETIDWLSEII